MRKLTLLSKFYFSYTSSVILFLTSTPFPPFPIYIISLFLHHLLLLVVVVSYPFRAPHTIPLPTAGPPHERESHHGRVLLGGRLVSRDGNYIQSSLVLLPSCLPPFLPSLQVVFLPSLCLLSLSPSLYYTDKEKQASE